MVLLLVLAIGRKGGGEGGGLARKPEGSKKTLKKTEKIDPKFVNHRHPYDSDSSQIKISERSRKSLSSDSKKKMHLPNFFTK